MIWTIALTLAAAAGYARPELLIEPVTLSRPKVAATLVILDARPEAAYRVGHIPDARHVDPKVWELGFDPQATVAWQEILQNLGLTPKSKVVVYDANRNKDAARVWWILKYWGVADVRLLHGGWPAWEAAQLPRTATVPTVAASQFPLAAQAERYSDLDLLRESVKTNRYQIVDARSTAEHCGDEKLQNKRAGAIPGAKPLEWSDLLEPTGQRFRSPEELKKRFAEAGIQLDQPTVAHCQGGGRAAVMAFGMELMGAPPVRNYYRSWGEWGNREDTPIVQPKMVQPKNP
jgi:thiosulfate/3-mercaptopyruvate sulfurtransferase